MAKGSICPSCGEQSFHIKSGVRECSNPACAAVGWVDGPGKPGSGKGSKCKVCQADTYRRLFERVGKFTLDCCTTCGAMAVKA